ncbi:hypothetical protein BDV06DRAFT_186825 [Aspergillus oleicola]
MLAFVRLWVMIDVRMCWMFGYLFWFLLLVVVLNTMHISLRYCTAPLHRESFRLRL